MRKYIFLAALALLAGAFVYHQSQDNPAAVTITVDGKELYHLSERDLQMDRDIEIQTEYGYNVVHIGPAGVYMKSADCPDRLCVKQGKLTGRPIVCLPHKVVVTSQVRT